MMDQMGEVDYAPGEPKGTPWHPHRGFETVTYIIDGVFDHQDSHGGGGSITNGDTQWMTAGSGILHIETPPEWLVQPGGLFHGIQLWVNLPRDDKMDAPRYQDIRSGEVALAHVVRRGGAGAGHRRAASAATAGPGSTHTPMTLVHATVEPGARLDLPWDPEFNALVYVLNGQGTVGTDGRPIRTGQAAVLGAGDYLTITADGSQESRSPKLDVIVVGGRPIGEPIAWAGPFVMNTKAEVLPGLRGLPEGHGSAPSRACTSAPTTPGQHRGVSEERPPRPS